MNSKLLVQIHVYRPIYKLTKLCLLRSTKVAQLLLKKDANSDHEKGGGSNNITLVFGCSSVISCIVKIFPKGSDPQLVPVTRCRSSPLFSSSGPAASSATQFHCSEVLQSFYKTGKCRFFPLTYNWYPGSNCG